jgi:hypothetical protein
VHTDSEDFETIELEQLVTRRDFVRRCLTTVVGASLAAKAVDHFFPVPRDFEWQEGTHGYVRLRKVTGRIEVTGEALRKTKAVNEANRAAFREWAEEEIPRELDELTRLMRRAFEDEILPANVDMTRRVMESIDQIPPATGRYFEIPVNL